MGAVGLLACVALATVFAVSGVAKLLDRAGTREAVAGFGVPRHLGPAIAAGLAPVEIAVAVLLLVPATSLVGLHLAAGLLAAFTAAVVLALRAGRRPDCHCFGRIGGSDVSGRTVARNLVLLGIVVLGVVGSAAGERPSGGALVAAVVAGLAAAAAVIAGEALAGRAARRRRDAEAEATFRDAAQATAPEFRLPTLAGGAVSLADLLAPGLPLLLVTLSPGCGTCRSLRPDVAQWAQVLRSRVTVAVLATGTPEDNLTSYAGMDHLTVLVDEDRVRDQLGVTSTPSAVLIGPDGIVASGVASGEARVRRLLVQALTGAEPEDGRQSADAPDDQPAGVPAEELALTSTVAARSTVEAHPAGEGTVLLDTRTGATVVVDQIGALVWSVLDGRDPLADVVADLADVFGVPAEQVAADVLALVRALGEAGLLEGVAPADAPDRHAHAHAAVG